MHRNFGMLAAFAVAGTVAIAACESGNSPTLVSTGKVNVLLTDAPFPFSQVKSVDVFVTRIDGKLAETDSAAAANTSDSSSWVTLVSPNKSINLLTLTNGQTSNLGVATIPVGTYKSFRMIIDTDQSSITLNDNSTPDIKWPSAGKNGIKILLDEPFDVTNGTTNLLIDFDVGRSFVMRGNSISQNGLLFKPVIHATTQQNTGTITGSVRADSASGAGIAGATVEVLKAGTALTDTASANVVRTGTTDGSGNFTLAFVPPGTYVVRATPTVASGYKPALLAGGAVVTAGNTLSNQVIIVTK
ncbi:MAG TPA: DUF4382 domain-containing protein [Gemmatimonadaceae bacterium]